MATGVKFIKKYPRAHSEQSLARALVFVTMAAPGILACTANIATDVNLQREQQEKDRASKDPMSKGKTTCEASQTECGGNTTTSESSKTLDSESGEDPFGWSESRDNVSIDEGATLDVDFATNRDASISLDADSTTCKPEEWKEKLTRL